MSTITVKDLLSTVHLGISGSAKWGQRIPTDKPGIYVISTSSNPLETETLYSEIPLCTSSIEAWLQRVSTLKLNANRPSPEELTAELAKFWLSSENIIYIGKAGNSISTRINQFYRTQLGDRKPHAGGSWIKTLSVLSNLTVFWAETNRPETDERLILHHFALRCSSNKAMPFGNLETYILQSDKFKRIRKPHNVKNWKLP